jgi:hypothetical protein
MFGLNKDKKGKGKDHKPFFEFPLEQDMQDQKKLENMMISCEKQIAILKKNIREGAKPEEYEHLGILLHGYSALLKIINQGKKL